MSRSDTNARPPAPAAPPLRLGSVSWVDWLLLLAAGVALFAAIQAWFDWRSGIQGEPGTMLVIVASALLLFGQGVTDVVRRGWIRRLFQGLILLGAILTALAAWFLMNWVVTAAMIVAALAQVFRMMRSGRWAEKGQIR